MEEILAEDKKRFQILAFDGGGILGLFAACVLSSIEDDLGIEVTNHFDLLAGTSTGGIIALALANGMRPKDIVKFYMDYGKTIFKGGHILKQFYQPKYSNKGLELALKTEFGDKCIADCQKRVLIPTYDIEQNHVIVRKTRHHENFNRDHRVKLWQVAMETTAAPTYFPVFIDEHGCKYIDGALAANNPSLLGIIEAYKFLGVGLDEIHVLNISTMSDIPFYSNKLNNGGFIHWGKKITDAFLKAQHEIVYSECRMLIDDRYYRIDVKVPANTFKMDKLNYDTIISYAYNNSKAHTPKLRNNFFKHIAAPYQHTKGENDDNKN